MFERVKEHLSYNFSHLILAVYVFPNRSYRYSSEIRAEKESRLTSAPVHILQTGYVTFCVSSAIKLCIINRTER